MSEEETKDETKSGDEDDGGSNSAAEFNAEGSEAEELEENESEDEMVTISREDLTNLQLFRNICFNIRENLEAIKSFKKVIKSFEKVNTELQIIFVIKSLRIPYCQRERQCIFLFWIQPSMDLIISELRTLS